MAKARRLSLALAAGLSALALTAVSVRAENLTAGTQEMLKALKLDAAILNGLDKELTVPQAWIDGSKKEGALRVRLTMHPSRFEKVRKVFEARYPWIKLEYSRGIGQARALGPLLAFKRGDFVTDIVSSFEPLESEYVKANALVNLNVLPNAHAMREEFNSKHGIGLAYRLQHYCIAYGKERIKAGGTTQNLGGNPHQSTLA